MLGFLLSCAALSLQREPVPPVLPGPPSARPALRRQLTRPETGSGAGSVVCDVSRNKAFTITKHALWCVEFIS